MGYAGKKWATVETGNTQVMGTEARPTLDGIDWTSATAVHKSGGGSQGCFFVTLHDGVVVVKGAASIAAEVLATALGQTYAVPVPRCRVVERESDEGVALYSNVVQLDDKNPVMRAARQGLYRKHLMVMEYCAHAKTLGMLKDGLEEILSSSANQESFFSSLGRICALDLLMRHTDRIPILVDNRGNPGNVMVDAVSGSCIGIDNAASFMQMGSLITDQYIAKCTSYIQGLATNTDIVHPPTLFLRSFLMQYCTTLATDSQLLLFQSSVLASVQTMVGLGPSTLDAACGSMDPSLCGIEAVQLPFLRAVLRGWEGALGYDLSQGR